MSRKQVLKDYPKFNLLAFIISIFCFGAAGYIILASKAAGIIPHPDGTLVRIKDESSDPEKENVYQIKNGKLFLFPSTKVKASNGSISYNDQILNSYGYTRTNAKVATAADLQLPKTDSGQILKISFREGTILSDGANYWMVDEIPGTPNSAYNLLKINDPGRYGVALGYTFLTWKYDIVQISAVDLSKYGNASGSMNNYDVHSDGTVIKNGNDYYLVKDSKRYKIPNSQVARSQGYDIASASTWARVKQATAKDLQLPDKSSTGQALVLDYREGSLLRCTVDFQSTGSAQRCGRDKLYVVDDKNGTNVKREFTGSAFSGLGYNDGELIAIDGAAALSVPVTDTANPVMLDSGGVIPSPVSPPTPVISSPTNNSTYQSIPANVSFNSSGSAARSGGNINTYTWQFGDGTSASGASASHSYTKAGSYSVTLTVVDDKGLTGSTSITVKVDNPPVASDPTATGKFVGWDIYDFNANMPQVRAAIRRQKPSAIRWFFDMDRYVRDETTGAVKNYDANFTDQSFQDFLKAIKEVNTTLIVTLSNKGVMWPEEYRACSGCNYPDMLKYTPYIKKFESYIKTSGVNNVIWEPWNEPDLRWGSLLNRAPSAGATENFSQQWVPINNIIKGGVSFSGGNGDLWRQMHQITSFPQASGGIIHSYAAEWPSSSLFIDSANWIKATAPYVTYTSFHLYQNNYTGGVTEYVNKIAGDLALWQQVKGTKLKFYIGEIGSNSGSNYGVTNTDGQYLRDVHTALSTDPRTKDYYMGMTAHIFAPAEDGTRVDMWEPRKGWWEPDFNANDIPAESKTL